MTYLTICPKLLESEMIPVEIEQDGFLKEPAEKCCLCGELTRYWHKETNKPVCIICAQIKEVANLIPKTKTMPPW